MLENKKNNNFDMAEKDAGKLLSKRMHSTGELKKKLSKKYNSDTINKLIDKLQKLHILNDARFAKAYADELHNKGFGRNLIFSKLRQRGLNLNDINMALPKNPDSDESDQARTFIMSKMKQILRQTEPHKRKIKFIRTLLNRGFNLETAQNLAEKLLQNQDASP